jgi:hypothetical protein
MLFSIMRVTFCILFISIPVFGTAQTIPEPQRVNFLNLQNARFLGLIHRGRFEQALALSPTGRLESYAAYVAFVLEYRDDVEAYGESCIFAGDGSGTWSQSGNTGLTSTQVYLPERHISFFRTAIDAIGFTPGINFTSDMGRLFRQEGCASPGLARLRENLYLSAVGQPPVSDAFIAERYRVPAPPEPASTGNFATNDWSELPASCYSKFGVQFAMSRGQQSMAAYCVCFERSLREDGEVGLYNEFHSNFLRAQDAHWSGNDVISKVLSTCSNRPTDQDYERGLEVLNRLGVTILNRRQ